MSSSRRAGIISWQRARLLVRRGLMGGGQIMLLNEAAWRVQLEDMFQEASRVKICPAGSMSGCVVSNPGCAFFSKTPHIHTGHVCLHPTLRRVMWCRPLIGAFR